MSSSMTSDPSPASRWITDNTLLSLSTCYSTVIAHIEVGSVYTVIVLIKEPVKNNYFLETMYKKN